MLLGASTVLWSADDALNDDPFHYLLPGDGEPVPLLGRAAGLGDET